MKGYVYKLWSLEGPDIYIGSTKDRLCNRLSKHRYDFRNYKDCSSVELFKKYIDVKIEMLEIVHFDDILELRAKEGQWIRKTNCVNKQIPGRTRQEYRNENKEKILENVRKYQQENKEQHLENCKNYYKKNREKILEKDKNYYETHKEQHLEICKNYYEKNKEIISEKRSIKIVCECGCEISKCNLPRHKKSNNHINKINELNKNEPARSVLQEVSIPVQ